MNGATDTPIHRTYLLTIWEERSKQAEPDNVWRYRLEDPHSGKKYLFATLAEVTQFLDQLYCVSKA